MSYSRKYADYRRWALIAATLVFLNALGDNDGSVFGWLNVAAWTVGIVILLHMAYRDRQDRIRFEREFTEAMKNPGPPIWLPTEPGEDR